MSEIEADLVSNYTQGVKAYEVNKVKRTFKIFAADSNTVATVRNPRDGLPKSFTYHPKSHAKALEKWKDRPVIINHGTNGFTIVGRVTDADIAAEGLVLSFVVDDDRMLDLINKNSYEGFSIGSALNPNPTTLDFESNQILDYSPVELSVIMYPERPACPKGVCDIISMMSSCNHQNDEKEVDDMAEEGEGKEVHCTSCAGGNKTEVVSKAEHMIVLSAKDDKIKELKAQIETLEADVRSKSEALTAATSRVAEFEKAEKLALASSLPQDLGFDYASMSKEEIDRLVKLQKKVAVEDAGAEEVPTGGKEGAETKDKPWIRGKYKPGEY